MYNKALKSESFMNAKYSGRCLCGEISYSVDVEPVFTGNCHCKDCQRSSGSSFIPAMVFPEKDIVISGEVKYFESQADSGDIPQERFLPELWLSVVCPAQQYARNAGYKGWNPK